MSIQYIEMYLRNKTTSEFRTVLAISWMSLILRFQVKDDRRIIIDPCMYHCKGSRPCCMRNGYLSTIKHLLIKEAFHIDDIA